MDATDVAALTNVSTLLREGKVQEADDALAKLIAAAQATPEPTPPPATEPPPALPAAVAHFALLEAIVSYLGSAPRLVKLLEDVKAGLSKL